MKSMPSTKKSSGTPVPTASRPRSTDSLLGVDLSMKCTGWAFFVGSSLIEHGHISFSGMEHGEAACALTDELSRILKKYEGVGINGVGYEYAFAQKGSAAEDFGTLQAALKMWAYKNKLPVYHVHPSTLKKAVAGSGRAEKEEVIEAVERRFKLGLDPERKTPDSDIADAIGVVLTLKGS